MKTLLTTILLPCLLTLATLAQANTVTSIDSAAQNRLATWQHMHDSKAEQLQQYMDMKFGMFIHWGAYANLGGQWQGKEVPGVTEWIMLKGKIPRATYKKDVVGTFMPTKFMVG